MEEFYYKHPLDKLLHNDNIYLLESMIPYVGYELKFPLVLLIKFFEIKKLHYYFSDRNKINSCGLHNDNHDFSNIIHEFENMDHFSKSSSISQIINMYKSMEMFKKMNAMMESMGMGSMGDMMSGMMNGNGSPDTIFNFMSNMGGSNFNPDFMSNIMNSFSNNNPTNDMKNNFNDNDSINNMMNNFNDNNSINNMMNNFNDNDSINNMMNAFNFSNNMPINYPNEPPIQSDIILDSNSSINYEPDSNISNTVDNEESLEFDFDNFFEKYNQNNKENNNE